MRDVKYIETSSKALPFKILEIVSVKEEIEYGFRYTYYRDSKGNLYTGFLTNSVEAWQKENEQMRLELF